MTKDFGLVTLIGFLVGWLVLIPAANIGLDLTPIVILNLIIGFTAMGPLAMLIMKKLAKRWKVMEQFGKFAAVGTLNSFVDLAVLNWFILFTNISFGLYFTLFKTLSFLVAKTSSYFWNKFWTFDSHTKVSWNEYWHFAIFTIIGAVLNVGVATFMVNVISPPVGVTLKLWANVGAVVAAFASVGWNFFSYRHVVFK
ncbi:GtrA family protein [Candidatus Jorgensenbacteria bacterium]|nr:GtrA family protein [Candidatus Jorgensenbacteria bacterium]